MGNYVQLQRPSPVDYIADFVQNYMKQRQLQQAQDQQRQQAAIKLAIENPQVAAQVSQMNPDFFKGVNVPAYQAPEKTPMQLLQEKAAQDALDNFNKMPGAAKTQGGYELAYGKPMAADTVKLTNTNDVYANPQGYAPQMQTVESIANKITPTGQEAWTDQNITLPKTSAEIGKTTAETGKLGAETGKVRAETGKVGAETNEINTKTSLLVSANDPVIANWVAAVKGAVSQGLDPKVVLSKIADKKIAQRVGNELAKPENASILQSAPIAQSAKTAIAEIDPLIAQAKKVILAYAPYKDQNGFFTDRDLKDYGLYMAGQEPPADSPMSQVANMSMLGVQAGARLLKGGSRAYPALKMAMQHAPHGTETRAQIYDKTVKLLTQLEQVRADQLRLGAPVTAAGAAEQPTPQTNDDPLGILK